MEKLKLIGKAVADGVPEALVQEVFQEESLIDFDLGHLKEIIEQRKKEKEEAASATIDDTDS